MDFVNSLVKEMSMSFRPKERNQESDAIQPPPLLFR